MIFRSSSRSGRSIRFTIRRRSGRIRPRPGRFTRDPFPGNIIPSNRIDPVATPHHRLLPAAESGGHVGSASTTTPNPTAVAYETYYTATARVDHNLSSKHRLYGRFSWDFWEEEKDDRFDNEATGIFLNRKNRIFGARRHLHLPQQPAAERSRRLHAPALSRAAAQPGVRPCHRSASRRVWSAWPRRTWPRFRTSPSTTTRPSAPGSRATAISPPTSIPRQGNLVWLARRSQPEVRRREPDVYRGRQPLSHLGLAPHQLRQPAGRAGRWTTRRPPRRAGSRVVPPRSIRPAAT